jgi:hypothetical protein
MLNVTGLFYPSNPKSPVNFASMAALYAPQGDFRMDGLMGWEAGQRPRRLGMEARFGPSGSSILASFLYADDPDFGPVPVIIAGSGAQIITMPAPPPGLYSFTIARVATHFEYYFDGNFVGSLPDPWRAPATGVLFDFVGPYPGLLGPLHIDRIQVVPTPATPLVILTIAMMCGTHRKRKSSAPASVIKAMQARAWVA